MPSSDEANDSEGTIPSGEERTIVQLTPQSGPKRSISVGDVLNHMFEVKRFIKAGGVGQVFEGSNVMTGERVAIKALLPTLAADPKVIALFQREAMTLTRLNHEALVQYRVLAKEPQSGILYIVTEFVDGVDLGESLGQIDRNEEELRQLMERLASGLAAAHKLGAIHRDMSPDNVMLPGGDVHHAKIIDFGIAKDTENALQTLIGSAFAGKLNYVAPEQLGEHGGEIGPWTDVYSLALVMLAVAGGKRVDMSGSFADAIRKRREGVDVSAAPEGLRPLLAAMLKLNPAERIRSMAEVQDWLEEAADSGETARKAAEADRAALEAVVAERAAVERAAAERAALQAAEAERAAIERAATEQAAREAAEAERVAREAAEAEQAAREAAEAERAAREAAAAEQAARDAAEAERIAREAALAEQAAQAERIAREAAEAEQAAREAAEAERAAQEAAAAEQAAREAADAERIAREAAAAEQAAQEAAEAERVAREAAEAERVAQEAAEAERAAREVAAAEQAARDAAEAEWVARQAAAAEQAAREAAEVERAAQEAADAERAARETAEAEQAAREAAASAGSTEPPAEPAEAESEPWKEAALAPAEAAAVALGTADAPRRRALWPLLVIVAVIALAAAGLWFWRPWIAAAPAPSAPAPSPQAAPTAPPTAAPTPAPAPAPAPAAPADRSWLFGRWCTVNAATGRESAWTISAQGDQLVVAYPGGSQTETISRTADGEITTNDATYRRTPSGDGLTVQEPGTEPQQFGKCR